jgi:hypothetical protein
MLLIEKLIDLHNNLERLVNQTRTSQKTPLLTVLLEVLLMTTSIIIS